MKRIVIVLLGILMAGNLSAQNTAAPVAALADNSIYHASSDFLDMNGKPVKLSSLKGRPVVISMGYTSCPHACPLILARMQDLQREIQKAGLKVQPQFVVISFDYEHDTPAVLKKFAETRHLQSDWMLFAATSDRSPREIANLLGIQYRKMDGGYDHSFTIAVLDSQGVIKGRLNGADKDPKDLLQYLNK